LSAVFVKSSGPGSLESYSLPETASPDERLRIRQQLKQRIARARKKVCDDELEEFDKGVRDLKDFLGLPAWARVTCKMGLPKMGLARARAQPFEEPDTRA